MMRPAFAKYSDFDTEHTRFASKYSLYLYREGGIDEDTMVSKPCSVEILFANARNRSKVCRCYLSQVMLEATNRCGL